MTPQEIQQIIEDGRKLGNYKQVEALRSSYKSLAQAIKEYKLQINPGYKKPTRRKMTKNRKKDLDKSV